MNMGRLITQLKRASSVPAGSSYAVAMGDGTGTKQVSHETVVESVRRDLPLGDVEELETENKTDIVGAVNEIVEKLSIVGISYKGEYNPETEYRFLDAVFHENSTFIAMKNSPEGEPLADGINWQYLAKGFMDGYLIAKSQIVNNLLATEPGNVLDAMQGKALADMISGVNSNLANATKTTVGTATKGEKFSHGALYYVRNGMCIVSLESTPSAAVSNGDVVLNGLPKPYGGGVIYLSLQTTNGNCYSAIIRTSGNLEIYFPAYTTASRIDTCFSYFTTV